MRRWSARTRAACGDPGAGMDRIGGKTGRRILSQAASSRTSLTAAREAIVSCERCPRLRDYCAQVAREKRRAFRDYAYWGKPVPGFGDPAARVLLVGLAPAAHGAN